MISRSVKANAPLLQKIHTLLSSSQRTNARVGGGGNGITELGSVIREESVFGCAIAKLGCVIGGGFASDGHFTGK